MQDVYASYQFKQMTGGFIVDATPVPLRFQSRETHRTAPRPTAIRRCLEARLVGIAGQHPGSCKSPLSSHSGQLQKDRWPCRSARGRFVVSARAENA